MIIRRYCSFNQSFFYTIVTYQYQNSRAYMQYEELTKDDGTLYVIYISINPDGTLSNRIYKTFEDCYWDYAQPFDFPTDLDTDKELLYYEDY